MTRLQVFEKELENLEVQMVEIETNFGKAAAPVELEQQINELRHRVKQLKDEENRKSRFLDFCEKICLAADLQKITDNEFRKKELYDKEVAVKYDDDPADMFRIKVVTVLDYTSGEISAYYKRTHEKGHVESKQQVIFKVTQNNCSFNNDGYDKMLKFIRMNAAESVSFIREAEFWWTITKLRKVFAQQGMPEVDWTPAESELNL